MRRRPLLNLILAGLVVALAALLWLSQPGTAPPQPILSFGNTPITHIAIAFPGQDPTIRLERSDHGWRLRAPVHAQARAAAVDQILRLAERESKHRMPLAEVNDLDALGLEPPIVRVTFNDKTVALGATEPIHDRRYARVGDTVHLITTPNMGVLNADYSDLVSWRLLPKGSTIQRLVLPTATITPTGDGGWRVAASDEPVGANAAGRTVALWKRARAMFVQPAGDENAQGQVRIDTAQHGTLVFEILSRDPQLLLRRPDLGVTFHVAGNRVAPLLDLQHPKLQKLKSHSVIPLAPDQG